MTHFYLFSDASCNPSTNKSIGCYTLIQNLASNLDIHIHKMDFSSSTMAELHTIREALKYTHKVIKELNVKDIEITLYVDCKNFVDLIVKRKDKENIKTHRNYELYKELIDLVAVYKTNVCWLKGHDKKDNKILDTQKIFSVIDKKARELCRELA